MHSGTTPTAICLRGRVAGASLAAILVATSASPALAAMDVTVAGAPAARVATADATLAPSPVPGAEAFAGAQVLTDQQMDEVEGEFLWRIVGPFVAGSVSGAAKYSYDYFWGRYVRHENKSWSWRDFGTAMLLGGTYGVVRGTIFRW